jgi:hypothetical protein
MTYYTSDYVLGYWLKVYPSVVKRSNFWLFDRYFYDYFTDPVRGRICLPKWLITVFGAFVSAPDVILCLGGDPEVIYRRKPELPVSELRRQVEALREFCKTHRNAIWIDAGASPEECLDHALTAIRDRLASRYE